MKARLSKLAASAGVTALVLGLAACGGGGGTGAPSGTPGGDVDVAGDSYDGPNVTLTLWNQFTGDDGPYFAKMIDEFNAAHENIQIKSTSLDAGEMYSKIPTAIKSKKGPDIVVMAADSVPTMAAQGNLLGLDEIAQALNLSEDDFTAPAWNAGEYKGVRYSIPLDMHLYGLFYNKDLFKEAGLDPENAPQTRDDYMAALEALKTVGIQGHWEPTYDEWGFRGLLKQFGGAEFNDEGTKAIFNSDAGVEALTWMRSLIDDGYSPANVDDPWKAFIAGNNAMGFFGTWSLGDKALENVNFGTAPFPQIGDQAGVWGGSHQFTITTQAANDSDKLAAAAFAVNYLSENSIEWAKANQVPARASVRELPAFTELTNLQPFAEMIDYIAFNPTLPGLNSALDPINQAINKVLVSNADPKQALDEAANLTDAILKDNQAKYGY